MFSVIIPAYNAEPFIRNSIQSVLAQTVDDFEIVVVDDGSKDNTKEVIKSIEDLRIRYIYQENAGVSAARNKGIQSAKGEYVCFLDADDLWKPNHLEVLTNLINKYPEASVYLTGYEILLHNGKTILKCCPLVNGDMQSHNVFKQIWEHGYFIHTNSIACKSAAFNTVGLFEVGIKNGEDDDMWYRLFSFFSAAISREITTTYIRENSNATVKRMFVDNWVFLQRVDQIMGSPVVSSEKKDYLRHLLEQRKLSFVRYCILVGDKKTARKQMKTIDKRLLKKKKYLVTLAALVVPTVISTYIISKRDKHYYGD